MASIASCKRLRAWDSASRPVTIDTVSATYDALGRMVEQNRSGSYTQIVYCPGGAKLSLMNGQTLQKSFVPLPGGGQAVYNSSGSTPVKLATGETGDAGQYDSALCSLDGGEVTL